jgi:predicted nucleic acid-binding protein
MVIVSDASPIIALALCDKLDLLDGLFGQVCIPQAVYKELTIPNKPKASAITEWAKQRVVSVKNTAAMLIRNDFRISDILYQQILERAGE